MSAPGDARAVAWLAAGAALLGWWLAPQSQPAPKLVKPRGDAWSLPPQPRIFDQTTLAATVLGAPYWGAVAVVPTAAAASAPDEGWRLAAIFGHGSARGVLVEFSAEGKAAQRLRVGDQLPDGRRIVCIEEREICVRDGARKTRLGVERRAN